MPGKKDYVSILYNACKQEHLLLCNLKYLCQDLSVKNPASKTGFYKFVCLHPK